jgi:hypothetical protein
MKTYSILGKFPDALAKATFQSVTLNASTASQAASRAIKVFKKRPGIKHRSHGTIILTIEEVPNVDLGVPESD